jgi:catechol 2,3-dioxygenase-like lactoylglutathione lyase family enzyme
MEPHIDVITLAVGDLERSLEFYRDGLGLESGGLLLMLYPRTELAKDADIPLGPAQSGEFSIGHAVASRAEVDAALARAEAAGATLPDRPHDRPWGIYSGYFRDLDGHLWEVLWNPRLERPDA